MKQNKKTAPARAASQNHQPTLYQNHLRVQLKFDRADLPPPELVLQRLGIVTGSINHAGYYVLRCPFHKDGKEHNPSLNLHALRGNYRCHACGVKGGDILSFYMASTGKKFTDAVHDLTAWSRKS